MGAISININFVEGTVSKLVRKSVQRTEKLAVLISGLIDREDIANLSLDEVRLYFQGVLLDLEDTIAQVDLQDGDTVLALVHKPSRGQGSSSLIDLKINGRLTVLIVDSYPEKGVFLVADHFGYGLPVCFIGTSKVSVKIGMVVSADYVGAKLKGSKVEFLVLENAIESSESSLCPLSKPVVLVLRRELQVHARTC